MKLQHTHFLFTHAPSKRWMACAPPLSPRLTARCVTAGEGQTEGDGYERIGRQKLRDELMEVGPVNVKDDQEEDMIWVHKTLVTC